MAKARFSTPERQQGVTDFSSDNQRRNPLDVIRLLKQTAWVWTDLDRATTVEKGWGRRGDHSRKWVLAFLGFTMSDSVDLQPRWDSTNTISLADLRLYRQASLPHHL